MSVSGIPSSTVTQLNDAQYYQEKFQQIKNGFQQLGSDLQAGNLAQAQQDFTALSQNITSSQQSNSPMDQDFNALGQALQIGNVSDAQKAYTSLLQDLQQAANRVHHHHHHRHHAGGSQSASSASSPIAQAFDALGKALQSGDLPSAQQAYLTIQQDLQQFGLNVGAVSNDSAAAQTPGSNLNVTT